MKILYIDETFHPNYGYQSNPLAKFQQAQGHEVTIATVEKKWLYPVYRSFGDDGTGLEEADAHYENTTGVKIIRVPAKGYFLRRLVYTNEIFRVVDEVKPDVLFVHCVETLTAMRFLLNRRLRKQYPMMLDSHMLAMASSNPLKNLYDKVYRLLITRVIRKEGYEVIRTQDNTYVNDELGIPEAQTPFISFGTDTMLFYPSTEKRVAFREEWNIPQDAFVVVYTGKLNAQKNGKLLAKVFEKKFDKPVVLICVGSLPDTEYGKEVGEILGRSENRVILFPTQKYHELAKFYQVADLSVFPKQCSMSFYDAQACGLPVLSEDNAVNVDRCRHGNGMNFKAKSVESFRSALEHLIAMPKDQYDEMRKHAHAFIMTGYGYGDIAQKYTQGLERAVERYNANHKRREAQ